MTSQAMSFSMTKLRDFVELTKPRLSSLVIFSTAVGFFLALDGPVPFGLLLATVTGTTLTAAGAMALNQWMEARFDRRMNRTAGRPLPTGRLSSAEAFIFGALISAAGLGILYFAVNAYAFLLAAITNLSYLVLYTPLKRVTSLCTIVGAVPGAVPPLIGWAAISGKPPLEAWVLFAIIFLWQMPHFLAIAWLYRNDFSSAGFRMLSVEDPEGGSVARQTLLYTAALLPVSLLPSVLHMTGAVYFVSALLLGAGFLVLAVRAIGGMDTKAKGLFRYSIIYLFLILIMMLVDKVR